MRNESVVRAIVELGGAWAFVRRHGLRVLQSAASLQIGGDAHGAEGMAADPNTRASSAARRWIMRQASTRFMAVAVSVPVRRDRDH
jgi:hypothetical protein